MYTSKPKDRFENLSKQEIFKEIDEIQSQLYRRNLNPEEMDDLKVLQDQLRVLLELERHGGLRR